MVADKGLLNEVSVSTEIKVSSRHQLKQPPCAPHSQVFIECGKKEIVFIERSGFYFGFLFYSGTKAMTFVRSRTVGKLMLNIHFSF